MAVLFSAVTVTAGEEEAELLVSGIPREYDDLEGWTTLLLVLGLNGSVRTVCLQMTVCWYSYRKYLKN